MKNRRGGFDRSKLSGAFMSNARAANDNVQGWGMDFDNPNQEAAIEDKQNAIKFTNYDQQ